MVDKKPEEKVKTEEKPKGILGKIKEGIDDKEEQLAILSTFVRLAVFCQIDVNFCTESGIHEINSYSLLYKRPL